MLCGLGLLTGEKPVNSSATMSDCRKLPTSNAVTIECHILEFTGRK